MKMNVVKKIGKTNYHFQFEGETLFKVLQEAQKLSFDDVPACGICKSDNLLLESHWGTEKGKNVYEYCSIKCHDCRASLTFGRLKEDTTVYFLRRDSDKNLGWKEYKKEEEL